jgi:hypothetical protein
VGTARRHRRDDDALRGEHSVERGRELRVTITNQIAELRGSVTEPPQQMSGLLGGPCRGRVSGHAEYLGVLGWRSCPACRTCLSPQAEGVDRLLEPTGPVGQRELTLRVESPQQVR